MSTRGVRGATTAASNTAESILSATSDLLQEMADSNGIDAADIGSIIFTVTADVNAAFPARAARLLGWTHVPLLDAQEIPVPDSLERCIRVLILWNTDRQQQEIVHVYQGRARSLRPDLTREEQR